MGRRLSCDTDSFDVGRYLSTVLVFRFLDFTVSLEIDHRPAVEFRRCLLKSQIDHPLYQRAIVAIVLEGCFASQCLRSCGSLHEGMLKSSTHRRDSGVQLFGRRIYEPGVGLRHCGDFVGTGVKVDCSEHRVNQRAEPAAAWPLDIGTRNLL